MTEFEDLRTRAFLGAADAQFNLAVSCANGRGVEQDGAEAVHWYRLAAQQGDAEAEFALGEAYKNGRGVPQGDAEAFRWYRLAAQQEHFRAQIDLAKSYLEGFGVSQDYELAHIWANLAIGNAPRDARNECIKIREQAAEHFSPSEILELQRRARAEPASSGLEEVVSNSPKPVTGPAPASPNPNQGLSTASVVPTGAIPTGGVSAVNRGVQRPAERAKASPLVIAVVIAGIAVIMWMFRYEYESAVLTLPNSMSVSYQVRTDRWTGTTCNVYPPGQLSVIPASVMGQSCRVLR